MSNEKSRIKELVPQSIAEAAGPFVEFLKKYYEFMYIDNHPSNVINSTQLIRDVERTSDYFLNQLYKEVGGAFYINRDITTDTSNIMNNLRLIYETKGSLESVKMLFRVIYGEEVDILLPSEIILIASDGRWTQEYSIFVTAVTGNPEDFYDNFVTIQTTSGDSYEMEVRRVTHYLNSNAYELIIQRQFSEFIDVGATVTLGSTVATVQEVVNDFTLLQAGTGFKVGEVFTIDDNGNTGLRFKITSTNGTASSGNIITYNYGYTTPLVAMLIPANEVVGGIRVELSTNPTADMTTYPNRAFIQFNSGSLIKYPGYYSSNRGFLSDNIFLQDNFFYQNYSYVIRSSIPFESYENSIKRAAHPAGMQMFGELQIENEFDLTAAVTAVTNLLRSIFSDEAVALDLFSAKIDKVLSSSVNVTDAIAYNFNDTLPAETINTTETAYAFLNPYTVGDYFEDGYMADVKITIS